MTPQDLKGFLLPATILLLSIAAFFGAMGSCADSVRMKAIEQRLDRLELKK